MDCFIGAKGPDAHIIAGNTYLGKNAEEHWAIPFEILTPLVEDFGKAFYRGSMYLKWISSLDNAI